MDDRSYPTNDDSNSHNNPHLIDRYFLHMDFSNISSLNITDGTAQITLNIGYNDTTLICPTKPRTGLATVPKSSNAIIMDCDGAELTEVDTDGFSWLYVFEQFWCQDVAPLTLTNGTVLDTKSYGVDGSLANLGQYLNCTTDADTNIRTCIQNTAKIVIPLETIWQLPFYTDPGVTPSDPISLNGTYLANCPTVYGHPFVANPDSCDDRLRSARRRMRNLRTKNMAAIPKKPTYILSPNCEILPDDPALSLGSIIADPFDPENSILNDGSRAPIPPQNIKCRTLPNWRSTTGKLRQHKLTIWASFLQLLVGIGFDVDGLYKNDTEDVYTFEKLETRSFVVDGAYITVSLAADGVAGFLAATRWKKPVFMVTGVKIAYGAHITSKRKKGWGAGGGLSGDGTAMGVPVSGGPKVENSVENTREVEVGDIPELVFAYRLSKIKVSEAGKLKHEPCNEGALFGMERDDVDDVSREWRLEDFDGSPDGLQNYQVLQEVVYDDEEEDEEMYSIVVKPAATESSN
ncbi:hypothetical protein G7Y89_g15226 [Cudoniella acicularis]|uniref:Uncharacterized protein n=1 Tax=Cudoniella acicularis TaxID=354080 RepID=A0A8H4VMJ2_9HELO|nr:hypothetical protein G7Y89_g15226 [Cudoniella acicularis]